MVSMPFVVFGGVSAYFYWEVRRARRALQTAQITETRADVVNSPFAEPNTNIEKIEEVEAVGASY